MEFLGVALALVTFFQWKNKKPQKTLILISCSVPLIRPCPKKWVRGETRYVIRTAFRMYQLWIADCQVNHVFQHFFLDRNCFLSYLTATAYLQPVMSRLEHKCMSRSTHDSKSVLHQPNALMTIPFFHFPLFVNFFHCSNMPLVNYLYNASTRAWMFPCFNTTQYGL